MLHNLAKGTPPVEHRGFESDAARSVLHPTITGLEFSAPNLTVLTDPVAATGQRTVLLLNELNPAPEHVRTATVSILRAPRATPSCLPRPTAIPRWQS